MHYSLFLDNDKVNQTYQSLNNGLQVFCYIYISYREIVCIYIFISYTEVLIEKSNKHLFYRSKQIGFVNYDS